MPELSALFPNKLREARENASLTRKRLAALCARLADEDAVRYTAVGQSTIQHLERGLAQPRASTAATLAVVLESSVAELFPQGIDVKNRLA